MTAEEVQRIHKSIRDVLIENGNDEYGDCIIDEICRIFNYPTTIDIYIIEQMDDGLYHIYDDSSEAIEVDFKTRKEALNYAKDNGMLIRD